MTVFLGCGFAAKYLEGGGNLSVPLQWMLGLRRLKLDAIWLELLPATQNPRIDRKRIENFRRRVREHGLAGRYCLLYQKPPGDEHDLTQMQVVGMSKRELLARLAAPNTLLNLSYSIHPPFLLQFERRIFCDLDPSEIFFWMTRLEMGQSHHHQFWTIGLNVHGDDCRLPSVATLLCKARGSTSLSRPSSASRREAATEMASPAAKTPIRWNTFYPLVDTRLYQRRPRPRSAKFTTIGQWYWDGVVEVAGAYPDLSKRVAFEPYLDLPRRVPEAQFELAMNIGGVESEKTRLRELGWLLAEPHHVARTPGAYRRYLASATAEFTAIKGVDVAWQTGWLSDRAAAFLAMGRPVVTEDTGAGKYLPQESGFLFVRNADEAEAAIREVLRDWARLSRCARACAEGIFDSAKNLRKILGP